MAFIHCHVCGWSQDDFYSPTGYNPAKSLADWNNQLFSPKLDLPFTDDPEFVKRNGNISTREVVAREYEKYAKRIRTMKWITWEAFKADPYKVCPACDNTQLDID
jgi:hypothetical protein